MTITQHVWMHVVGRDETPLCQRCHAPTEFLKVAPARSRSYVNELYLCTNPRCRHIYW